MTSTLQRERPTHQLKVIRVSTLEAMEAAGQLEVMEVVLEVMEVEETQEAPEEDQPRLHEAPTLRPPTATPSLRSSETEGTEPLQLEVTGLRRGLPAVVATPPLAGGGTPGSPTRSPSLRRRRLSQPTERKWRFRLFILPRFSLSEHREITY